MTDKNGTIIQTGDVVVVSGAYVQRHNGIYFVEHSPDDPDWSGDDHCLMRLRKDGRISHTKYKLCFWPILNFMSDKAECKEADEWNKAHAEIEVNNSLISNYNELSAFFREKEESMRGYLQRAIRDWGETSEEVTQCKKCVDFYIRVQERIE